jgi:hypothetical protein
LHRVAIVIVGGFLILLFLRFVRFLAFPLHLVSIVALLALVTVFILLLYVDFFLILALVFLVFRLYFRLVLGLGGDGKGIEFALCVYRDIRVGDIPSIGRG